MTATYPAGGIISGNSLPPDEHLYYVESGQTQIDFKLVDVTLSTTGCPAIETTLTVDGNSVDQYSSIFTYSYDSTAQIGALVIETSDTSLIADYSILLSFKFTGSEFSVIDTVPLKVAV